ncbi:hypothetical protein COV53_07055 [Candidatus Gottesmanbacteria bacterium CG11_big_fil_rev_8_21_14_0_20_37_11]|uniref:DUF4870 domain-containing protein n=3 Tax=Candidatus Gottesmaniibacteriota TaxID=1752720 RepID=A0A2M7RRK9_9BACT|nr:MAG: hypothetical protein AUJ73_04255 [Candidatus Gottesmanbacteria bacterium CG1_02_37_22]PIP32797.1 MAG: hypothetical protein COX23_02845 [Candidatus Gottesmanbacteria bacterium CG23_combo_of_CG06-09_8_20_14_all_37_19]PIR07672.1 MAG: hypothetical protein COV53_07055 [Candidatus Gottesmanbacteria bacterium CG11_big_fil_rev_8_21_14_0_20_37_11]PIZ02947.1 MAG: hypothetical protein COY59_02050 [Candidatus Gottesmanbacteria bacterium CG_4_10_14_0_8_um_filter_37_24]
MADKEYPDEKMLGVIAYLGWWITGLILLITQKKNAYVRFHAMQSTLLFGAITLLFLVFGIVPIIGWIIGLLISPVIWIVTFVLWLLLMWKAYNGEKYKLPYFGDLAEKQLEKMK